MTVAATATTSFTALGTTATVVVTDDAALPEAERLLRTGLDAIDRACSRFREDSDLAAVNRARGAETPVSPLLIAALRIALRAAERTGGLVDPTVGRAMDDLGYDRDFRLVGGAGPRPAVRVVPAPGWRTVRVDEAAGTVTVPRGVALDLGATAKGFAADRCAEEIARATGAGALVSLGGDIAVAGDAPAGGWTVWVTDDHRDGPADGAAGEAVAIAGGGLATSSTTVRRWGGPADPRHHIVDPRRGAPAAEVWRTVSVAAGSCADANVWSTAAIVGGGEAPDTLAAAGLPARLVRPDGRVVRVAGWPAPVA